MPSPNRAQASPQFRPQSTPTQGSISGGSDGLKRGYKLHLYSPGKGSDIRYDSPIKNRIECLSWAWIPKSKTGFNEAGTCVYGREFEANL